MDIFLTNNLTNKKEQFIPKDKKNIGMYVCGPTVYDDPHIGNARPLVIFDVLFKLLKNNFLVGGNISKKPIMSVAKPGIINNKAAKANAAPETIS